MGFVLSFFIIFFASISLATTPAPTPAVYDANVHIYTCSGFGADKTGSVGFFSVHSGVVRSYVVKVNKGKVSEIGGILATQDAIQGFISESRLIASGVLPSETSVANHVEQSVSVQQNQMFLGFAMGMAATFMSQNGVEVDRKAMLEAGIGSLGGMTGGVGFGGGGMGLIAGGTGGAGSLGFPTQSAPQMPNYGSPFSYDPNGPRYAPETRRGALIRPHGEVNVAQPALGQIIGREGVSTPTVQLNAMEEFVKLNYRSGSAPNVQLPSGNPAKDAADPVLAQMKSDFEKIKIFSDCCVNGVSRNCESKKVVQVPAAASAASAGPSPTQKFDPKKPWGENPFAPAVQQKKPAASK